LRQNCRVAIAVFESHCPLIPREKRFATAVIKRDRDCVAIYRRDYLRARQRLLCVAMRAFLVLPLLVSALLSSAAPPAVKGAVHLSPFSEELTTETFNDRIISGVWYVLHATDPGSSNTIHLIANTAPSLLQLGTNSQRKSQKSTQVESTLAQSTALQTETSATTTT
jgi:hypothetical protein